MSENEYHDYSDGSECYENTDKKEREYKKGVRWTIVVKKDDKKLKRAIEEFNNKLR